MAVFRNTKHNIHIAFYIFILHPATYATNVNGNYVYNCIEYFIIKHITQI